MTRRIPRIIILNFRDNQDTVDMVGHDCISTDFHVGMERNLVP